MVFHTVIEPDARRNGSEDGVDEASRKGTCDSRRDVRGRIDECVHGPWYVTTHGWDGRLDSLGDTGVGHVLLYTPRHIRDAPWDTDRDGRDGHVV